MQTPRIQHLKARMFEEKRYASIEQARIITKVYQAHEGDSIPKKRALALKASLEKIEIGFDREELIVGNRTKGVRAGVVFPESGSAWVNREFETLPSRPQDRFAVREEDIEEFRTSIYPYWQNRSLEDGIRHDYGKEIDAIAKVAKINQKDHAQGHICPDVALWLSKGPAGLKEEAQKHLAICDEAHREFYECMIITLEGAMHFMQRYHDLIMASDPDDDLKKVAENCLALSQRPAESFHEALQSLWFLFVILQMESNASSFSPGRADRYLYPYYEKDINAGILTKEEALELIECLFLKFNQIVYMRN